MTTPGCWSAPTREGVFKADDVVVSFRKAAATWGVPAGMLSDSGAVFTGVARGAGRVALERLSTRPPARSVRTLQAQLDTFGRYYNNQRPHRSLHRRTPAEAYAARPKAMPLPAPIIDPHFQVRRDRVNEGVITLRHNSRLHHIGIGRRHNGRRVIVLARDLDIRILTEAGELIRTLTLDPNRDYQPTGKP